MIETTVTLAQFNEAKIETFYMIGFSLVIGSIIGIPLGILLVVTRPGGIIESKILYKIINPIINIFRSLPFIKIGRASCRKRVYIMEEKEVLRKKQIDIRIIHNSVDDI